MFHCNFDKVNKNKKKAKSKTKTKAKSRDKDANDDANSVAHDLQTPELSQVVAWIFLATDVHYSQLVMHSGRFPIIFKLMQNLRELVGSHVDICESMSELRGCLAHIVEGGQLPVMPVPDYCVEGFQW